MTPHRVMPVMRCHPAIRHIRGMRSCWSGEDDQLVGGEDVTVVVRWVLGSTPGCGRRMARPVGNGWGPGAKWRRSDPQHVLRCSQGLPIGTTSPRWGARRRSSSRVASRNPSWAPGAVPDSMPEVKKAKGSRTCPETGERRLAREVRDLILISAVHADRCPAEVDRSSRKEVSPARS
jgi:hypothetical protein